MFRCTGKGTCFSVVQHTRNCAFFCRPHVALWPSPSGRQWGRLSITLFLTGLLKARHTVEEGGGVSKKEGGRGQ